MKKLLCVLFVLGMAVWLPGCGPRNGGDCDALPMNAVFTHSPDGGELPILTTFDASGSGGGGNPIIRYEWDFGDGRRAEGPVVRHKFERRPGGADEQSFTVTLTITRAPALGESPDCRTLQQSTQRTLRYGISRPLDVVRWEVKSIYYGTMIEGYVRVVGTGFRVNHGQVVARFYRGPNHQLVAEVPMRDGVWDLYPGEDRYFMITSTIRREEFDWVELHTVAQTKSL